MWGGIHWLDFLGLFLLLSGFVVGLGAVTVVDIQGLLGRKSRYWTEAATRTHKVTKPLIWLGMSLGLIGGGIFYRNTGFRGIPLVQLYLAIMLLLNGCFLSFKVSPFLLQREKENLSSEPIPFSWQWKIAISLAVSDIGWWGSLLLTAFYLVSQLQK
jgi:hypothetical protein